LSWFLLLTGSTGLLGRYLVRDLLERGEKLALNVGGTKYESAEERVESVLQFWEQQSGKKYAPPLRLHQHLSWHLSISAIDGIAVRSICPPKSA